MILLRNEYIFLAVFINTHKKMAQQDSQEIATFQNIYKMKVLIFFKNNNMIMDNSIGNYYLQAQASHQSFSNSHEVQFAYSERLSSLQHFQVGINSKDHPLEQYQKYLSLTVEISEPQNTQQNLTIQTGRSSKSKMLVPQSTIKQYLKARRGGKDDTMQLNINFKTLISQYFKQLRLVNELDTYELTKLNDFMKRAPSLKSLMIFLEKTQSNKGILAHYLDFFTSSTCISRVLQGRGRMRTKLMMIKFIEKMRRNAITINNTGQKWKENTKYLF